MKAVVLTFATALLLAGCGSDPEPKADKPEPTKAVPTAPVLIEPTAVITAKLGESGRYVVDPEDAGTAMVDILRLTSMVYGGHGRSVQLAMRDVQEDPEGQVIEVGLMVDKDGDKQADCHVYLSNTGAKPHTTLGVIRDLRTGKAGIQDKPPYGGPFDFGFITKEDEERAGARWPPDQDPMVSFSLYMSGPQSACDFRGTALQLYAYVSLMEDGKVVETDYAPDDAWLKLR